jgi:hypothetical protein
MLYIRCKASAERKKMVKNAQSRLPLIIGLAATAVLVLVAVFLLWPTSPPVSLKVSVLSAPVAGGTITIHAIVTSDKDRPVSLVAQLLTSDQKMVDIVRAEHQATKGDSEEAFTINLPASLPQGRYTAIVTGRYDNTKLVTADTSVQIGAATHENVTPIVVPPANVTPIVTPVNVTPPEIVTQNVTPPELPAVNESELPPIEPVQQQVPTVGAPMPMEIDDIVKLAETNKDQALAECAKLPEAALCVSRVAASLKDDSICHSLQGFDADKCFLSVASAGKADACASVQDEALRSTCEAVAKFGLPAEGS